MELRVCVQCRRHVDASERACPFCRVELAPTAAPRVALPVSRLSRATVFAGAALAGACWTSSAPRTTTVEDNAQQQRVAEPTPEPVAPGTIRGIVRDISTGAPLPGVQVSLHARDGDFRESVTNDRGEYVFPNLKPGTYTIAYVPRHPRRSGTEIEVTLAEGAGQRADLEVHAPRPDLEPCCMPYGAPPARRRVV